MRIALIEFFLFISKFLKQFCPFHIEIICYYYFIVFIFNVVSNLTNLSLFLKKNASGYREILMNL